MKQIFLVSTFFELVCLAAGVDSGAYDTPTAPALLGTGGRATADSASVDERILVVSNNAAVLELASPLVDTPGAGSLLRRFDRIIDLNDALAPAHPSSWTPAAEDLPIIEARFRDAWRIGTAEVELILESPQVNPAIALGRVFSRATIRVHADGLMSYGPTRSQIPLTNGQRMSTLHYLPLVDGLEPRLLTEFDIIGAPLSATAFRTVVDEVARATAAGLVDELGTDITAGPWALAVGQYLAALGLMSVEEETALHIDMVDEAARRGFSTLVFKPHPAAPPAQLAPIRRAAERSGIRLDLLQQPVLAEILFSRLRPTLVIGGFSTALATARGIYGIPALAIGTEKLLHSITPYQNSNRIPLTIISEICDGTEIGDGSEIRDSTGIRDNTEMRSDTGIRDSAALCDGTEFLRGVADSSGSASVGTELSALVDAVGCCMAPDMMRAFRPAARAFLADHLGEDGDGKFARYFTRKRLAALGLPGGEATRRDPRRIALRASALTMRAMARQQKRLSGRCGFGRN